jgi:hypothetical protein
VIKKRFIVPNINEIKYISNNWGQLIGVRSTLISNQKRKRLMGANNKWGQSNINFQSKVIKAKGG